MNLPRRGITSKRGKPFQLAATEAPTHGRALAIQHHFGADERELFGEVRYLSLRKATTYLANPILVFVSKV